MTEAFNPYHEWLGLAADVAQPNYYQLLGLADGEADAETIALASERATTRVRSFRPGAHAREWSRLLDEIQAAKRCLLEPAPKAEYDRRFERKPRPQSPVNNQPASPATVPAKTAADADRYPPGMAPPGARSAPAFPAGAPAPEIANTPGTEVAIAAELAPDLPPTVYAPYSAVNAPYSQAPGGTHGAALTPAAAPLNAIATAVPHAPLAIPLAGYAAATHGQPTAIPLAQPYSAAAQHGYGVPLDPMAPVAVPGYPGNGAVGSPAAENFGERAAGLAGSAPQYAAPLGTAAATVPMGTAVAVAGKPAGEADLNTPQVRSSGSLAVAQANRREKQTLNTLLIAGLGGGVLILAALLVYTNLPPSTSGQPGAALAHNQQPPPDASRPPPRSTENKLPTAKPTPIPTPPAVSPQPSATPTTTLKPAPAPSTTVTPLPESPPTPAQPTPAPAAPQPMLTPSPVPASITSPVPETAPTPPAPTTPTPTTPTPTTPAPPPEPPPPATSEEDLAALGKALMMGKAALSEQNFDEADKFIAQAQSLAQTPEHRAMAARLKEVAGYVRQFRAAVELAAQGFEAGESFKVGTSTQVAVVEVTRDKIIIRHTGQNKVYPYAELPPGLAVAIADFKLDSQDPVSRVVKGAFYAVSKGDQVTLRQKAKTWWEEAQLGGVNLTHLMPFLTDNYDLARPAGSPKKPAAVAKPSE